MTCPFAQEMATRILANFPKMLCTYKRTIRMGSVLSLSDALRLERTHAAQFYRNLTPESFAEMAAFLASKKRRGGNSAAAITAKL
jgi:hypothetical protein